MLSFFCGKSPVALISRYSVPGAKSSVRLRVHHVESNLFEGRNCFRFGKFSPTAGRYYPPYPLHIATIVGHRMSGRIP